jgi:hypothetical protein
MTKPKGPRILCFKVFCSEICIIPYLEFRSPISIAAGLAAQVETCATWRAVSIACGLVAYALASLGLA